MFTTDFLPVDLAAKGGCYTCLSADHLVNSGVIIEGEGILAICRACVKDMAQTIGLVLMDQDIYTKLEQAEEQIKDLRAELGEAELVIVDIVDAANNVRQRKENRDIEELTTRLQQGKRPDGTWMTMAEKQDLEQEINARIITAGV